MKSLTRLALVLAILANSVSAATYYVSTTGRDDPSNTTGAIGTPFLTIQHAANRMVGGDICLIRRGVYRETITPPNSGTAGAPISFSAYPGEAVVVSGANLLSAAWSIYSGSIYSTSTTLAIPQLFDNGVMMNVARWPNARPDDLINEPRATVQSSTARTNLTDSALPNIALVGGTLHLTPGTAGGEWSAFTRPITAYNTSTKTISWSTTIGTYTINPGNHYYIYGLLSLLDAPTEYVLDSTAHVLYLWTPNGASPASHTIEYKARTYAFDLSNLSYIDLSGLNIFAAGVNMTNTTSCLVDSCNVRYVQQNMTADWLTAPIPCANYVSGTGSIWSDSTIMFSSQDGIQLAGTGAAVNNCYISDVDTYPGSYYAAVTTISGSGHVISHNTFTRSGRYLIWPTAHPVSISYNDLSYGNQLTRDGGGIYIYLFDGLGTTIHHNWSHNNEIGIYLDNGTSNYDVYHNLCYDNDEVGIRLNAPGTGHQIYNNTIVRSPQSFAMYDNSGTDTPDQGGTNVINNLTENNTFVLAANATVSNNGSYPLAANYLPAAGSGAIDAGIVASPYTDGYLGAAPDVGAYEYGDPAPWTAGASFTPPLFPTFDLATAPATPAGLSATENLPHEIELSWVAPPSAVSGYQIKRGTSSGGPYGTILASGVVPSSYIDRTVTPGVTYYYVVSAVNSIGASGFSAQTSGAAFPDPVAEADAWVRSGTFGTTNYPSDSAVQIKADSTPTDDYNREAYVKFNVAGLAGASSVKLQLTNLGGSGTLTAAIEFISDDSWTETGITWNNKPAGTGVILATLASGAISGKPVPVLVDITGQVLTEAAGDGTLSLHIYSQTTSGSNAGSFGTRENLMTSYRPQLVVTMGATTPSAPTGLIASAASSSQINLNWTDNSGNETGFLVESSPNGTTFTQIASVGANVTSYSNTGLTASTLYYYRVRATNATGNSGYTSIASATTSPTGTAPAAPSGLSATAASGSQINLAWTDNSTSETGFYVERSPDGTTFTQIASVAANATAFSDTGLASSTVYYYRVRAFNAAGNSAYTAVASATTTGTIPTAPSGLSATAISSSQINLSWTDNSSNETGFLIERSPDGATFTQIASVGANVTTYSNTGLTASTTYYYRVRATNATGNSSYTSVASATTSAAGTLPTAPSGLIATAASGSQINLSWTDNSTNETGFLIERSPDGTTFTQITSVGANVTTYSNTGLAASTTYYYRVRATNATGNSGYSNVVNATTSATVTIPTAPSGLSATAASSSQINLAWTDNSSNETAFLVERSPDGTTFTQIASLAANTVTYSNTGLTASTTYYYRVRATNSAGNSAYSSVANATTSSSGTPTTVDLISVGAQDGYISESAAGSGVGGTVTATNTSSSALRIGDNYSNEGLRTFLSFDTSSIPAGATIVSATIKLKRGTISNTDPFTTLGTCYVDIKGGSGFGGSTTLAAGDFQAAADATAVATLTDGATTTGALNATGISYINRTGTTQLRIYFSTATDSNSQDDYEGYYSGENSSSGNKPVLEIVYQ